MRPLVGIALIVCGLIVVFLGIPYTSERQVMKIGDLEATVEEKRRVPAWLGVVAIVGGVAFLAAGRPSREMGDPGPTASRPR